uniref:Ubiquitin-like protease family profile domain-containing protein n=1 Tax=viral metagenome TaxID=1070528 RepID=A0A6C0F5W7_9ZZZZ
MTSYKKRNKHKKGGRATIKTRPNCNPAVVGHTVSDKSCLTKPLLSGINFGGNQSIRDVMKECDGDDVCVIGKIPDAELKEKIKNEAFVPKQPAEWSLNINEWLSDTDIVNVINQYMDGYKDFQFLGPSYIDFDYVEDGTCVEESLCKFSLSEYIKKGKTKIGIILNLDDHTKSGSHWVSLFIDVKRRFMFYFDSAGESIPKEVGVLIARIKQQAKQLHMRFRVYENSPFEHQYGGTECGMYSLFFLITMLTNKYEDKPFKNTKHIVNFFKRYRIPDKYMEKMRYEYFYS